MADPALPHQAGHEGKLPSEGREQPHGLHQVRADGLQSIHCLVHVDWGTSLFTDLTPSRINIKFHFAHNVLWLLKVYISCNAFDKISMDIEAQLHNTDLRWR